MVSRRSILGSFVAMLILIVTAAAQMPPLPPVPPPGPLMYIRFTGPKEAKLTIYRGTDAGQTLELPVTVGFRPGYPYRLALSEVPRYPRQVFYPSLEVRGSLALVPKLRNADFPAHINFNEEDLGKALSGTYVKKVITLERPDQALPIATKPEEPLEIAVPASRDPYVEAAERGQPLVTFQIGQRFLTPQELNAMAIPGTVLLPGERSLGAPRVPPPLMWRWCPVYDPVHGPRHPAEFHTIWDGGDVGGPAGVSPTGRLKGLDPTDTMAQYTDSKGNQRLAVSNRIGLCVPRFIIFRSELGLATTAASKGLFDTYGLQAPAASVGQKTLREQSQLSQADTFGGQVRLNAVFSTMGTSVAGRMQGLEVKAFLSSTESVQAITVKAGQEALPMDGPLRIIKWPDKSCVLVGELVTIYLKYTNTGGQPITNVIVTDSLTQRLEYVKGSTKADRDALFTMEPNEVGSSILRWEFGAPLPAGETGMISFQVRVR
jgi:uncharacterized repeat protein (TIGR01451 family)